MDIALTISNRQISPAVVNLFQFENGTTTLNFALDSYMYGEVNLRNYKAYAITSINGNIDMTELVMSYDASKDTLTLSWDVKEFTLLEAGAIVYQIVFKEATASGIPDEGENTAVFYTYKAILINREAVDADNEISAKYPTILKQWLDRMNAMADMYDVGAVYMKYGQSIPPADRLAGKLYVQYTDTLNTRAQFEDEKGNILGEYDVMHLVGDETIAGQKLFTTSPKVPTPDADDNSTKAANTEFVNKAVDDALSDFDGKYLPRSGGAMTVYKAIYRDVSDSYLAFYGGTRAGNDGAQLDLCGANHPSMGGMFQLHARNADVDLVLRGRPDGMLLWDTKYVLNNSFTMTTDGGAIMLTAGTSSTGGAYLRMYGKDHSSGQGTFHIAASDGTTSKVLKGTPDGDLTWNGKPIVVLVAEQKPTSSNGYTWYRKYSDGWVEQGGTKTFDKMNANASLEKTVSFPVQMADKTYYVAPATFITDAGYSTTLRNYRNTRNTTGLTIGMYTSITLINTFDIQWKVCGYAA